MSLPTLSKTLATFSFGTCSSFLAGVDRNWVYGACCSPQTAHKPVWTCSAKQTKGTRSLLSYVNLFSTPFHLEHFPRFKSIEVEMFHHITYFAGWSAHFPCNTSLNAQPSEDFLSLIGQWTEFCHLPFHCYITRLMSQRNALKRKQSIKL